jgi:hypothetical protein
MKSLTYIRLLVCCFGLFARVLATQPSTDSNDDLVPFTAEPLTSSGRAAVEGLEVMSVDSGTHHAFNERGNAISDYTRALEMSPGFVPAYVNRANALKLLGDLGAAIQQTRGDLPAAMADYNRALADG